MLVLREIGFRAIGGGDYAAGGVAYREARDFRGRG